MELNLYEWVYIVSDIFGTYTIYKFMNVFFETKKTTKQIEFLTYAGCYAVMTCIYLLINIPVVLMFSNLAILMGLTFNYEATIKKRIASVALMYLVFVCVELTVGLITGYFHFPLFSVNNYSSIYGLIIFRILSYVVVLILNNYKNIKKGETVPNSNWFSIVLIPVTSLYIILLLFKARGLSVGEVMLSVVLIFLINFATFYLFDVITAAMGERMKNILILEQNKYYDKQLDIMRASLATTNSIRHDLKNHMLSIYSLVQNGDKEDTMAYVSEIMNELGARQNFAACGNIIIDSIINFKFQEAVHKDIKTELELNIPEKLDMPSFDMTIILGNLLDNAIKAASETEGNRFINIKIKYDKGRLLIQVENPYSSVIKEKDGNLITTKEDKANHGIGLDNVKNVVQKYDGTMNIDYKGNIFSITILLYVD